MNDKIFYREIKADDAKSLLKLAENTIKEDIYSVISIEEFKYTIEEEKKWITSNITNANNICLIACNSNDEIIGSINIIQKDTIKLSSVSELDLNISKNYRNYGVGTKLLALALDRLKSKPNIKIVNLQVIKENERAIHLYKKFDFKINGIFVHYLKIGEKYSTLVNMYKNIAK